MSKPFRKFAAENPKDGHHLLEALYWEALGHLGEPALLAEPIRALPLNQLVTTAAKDAARRDSERPLDQQRARRKYYKLFQTLENASWGRVVVGRRGSPTRFVFDERFSERNLGRVLEAIGIEPRSRAKRENAVQGTSLQLGSTAQRGTEANFRRDDIVALLRAHAEEIRALGVRALSLFGSLARDEARHDSDVDLMVAFDGSVTSDRFFNTKFFLEDLVGRRIDLVSETALRARVRRAIEPELIRVA